MVKKSKQTEGTIKKKKKEKQEKRRKKSIKSKE